VPGSSSGIATVAEGTAYDSAAGANADADAGVHAGDSA
jgi:hypothetical protein